MIAEESASLRLFTGMEVALTPSEPYEPENLRCPPPVVLKHVRNEWSKLDIKVELKQFIWSRLGRWIKAWHERSMYRW